jgi:uncharacterized protein (TIGR02246 family)
MPRGQPVFIPRSRTNGAFNRYLNKVEHIEARGGVKMSVDQAIKQIVERQANAWATADSEKIIADFTDDSVFIVPGFSFRGKKQIKEMVENYFAGYMDVTVTIKRIIQSGNRVAVEWSWSDKNKKTGKKAYAEDAIVSELEGGKIKYWREYIDTICCKIEEH